MEDSTFSHTCKRRSTFHVEQPAALLVWAVSFFLSTAVLSAINRAYFRLVLQRNNFQYNLVFNTQKPFDIA